MKSVAALAEYKRELELSRTAVSTAGGNCQSGNDAWKSAWKCFEEHNISDSVACLHTLDEPVVGAPSPCSVKSTDTIEDTTVMITPLPSPGSVSQMQPLLQQQTSASVEDRGSLVAPPLVQRQVLPA